MEERIQIISLSGSLTNYNEQIKILDSVPRSAARKQENIYDEAVETEDAKFAGDGFNVNFKSF